MGAPREVPLLDLSPEIASLGAELVGALEAVVRSGRYILGPRVERFEDQVAAYLGSRHAVGVNSGTDALVIGLRALEIGPGDEVVTTPFSFFATVESICAVGATPVFADIDPVTLNLDAATVAERVTDRTRAIVPVHLFGHPAPLTDIMALARAHGLSVVEDVAQAFGASLGERKLGTIGDVGAFSFFPSKNLGALGDAGLIVTDDAAVAERARMLRSHGSRSKHRNEMIGYNSRLDEIQAAVLSVKLPHVDGLNAGRRRVARRYNELLGAVEGVEVPAEPPGGEHVFHQYTLRVADGRRDRVRALLAAEGIATAVYYPLPLHRLPVFEHIHVDLPNADDASHRVVSLPIWPSMGDEVIDHVSAAVRTALARPRAAGSGRR